MPEVTARARALVVRGGWEGHQPVETSDLVAAEIEARGFAVHVVDTLACYGDRQAMAQVDLVVQAWTMGEIGRDELTGLLSAVRSGTGICGWHGGLADAFRSEPDYQFMVGGQWVAHPDDKVEFSVRFVAERRDDPIVAGLADFSIVSEQYYCHVDPSNEVLATTVFPAASEAPWVEGTTMPLVWKRRYGEGRVFYCALGHDRDDFAVPEVLELVVRGASWASRRASDQEGS